MIIRIFKKSPAAVLGGVINAHCNDMIGHSLHKVLMHMGHVIRCESQNLSTSEVTKQYTGGALIITTYEMMKHEETRARESSRENYDKRGIVSHVALDKYKDNNNALFKRVCCMSPKGYGAQDAKATLVNLDVTYKCVKQDQI